jgi:predicted nucleic acid-binding protein
MRKVIVNSTPLIALCKVNQLDLLRRLYGEITVPKAVFEEVTIPRPPVGGLVSLRPEKFFLSNSQKFLTPFVKYANM